MQFLSSLFWTLHFGWKKKNKQN